MPLIFVRKKETRLPLFDSTNELFWKLNNATLVEIDVKDASSLKLRLEIYGNSSIKLRSKTYSNFFTAYFKA